MKKLMMAAAIVCAAVGVQAANFNWSFSEKAAPANVGSTILDISGYTMYVMTADAYTSWSTSGNLTFDTFKTATLDKATVTKSSTSSTTTFKAYADMENNPPTATWAMGIDNAQDLMFVLVDSGEKNFAAKLGDEKAEAYTPGLGADGQVGGLTIAKSADTHFVASNFQSFAVPEPTSGLLLLLGVAGLALRRRRA